VNEKLEALKQTVSKIFNVMNKFKLQESKSAVKNFAKQYTIDGEEGIDVNTFLKTVQPQVINLLETNRGVKFNVVLTCVMERVDMKTGQVTRTDAPFVSRTEVNLAATDVTELYQNASDKIKESMACFQMTGSNWRFKAIERLELNTVVYKPLRGSSYIPLPKALANKKVIINMKNDDQECFKWCVTRALNPVQGHADESQNDFKHKLRKCVGEM